MPVLPTRRTSTSLPSVPGPLDCASSSHDPRGVQTEALEGVRLLGVMPRLVSKSFSSRATPRLPSSQDGVLHVASSTTTVKPTMPRRSVVTVSAVERVAPRGWSAAAAATAAAEDGVAVALALALAAAAAAAAAAAVVAAAEVHEFEPGTMEPKLK